MYAETTRYRRLSPAASRKPREKAMLRSQEAVSFALSLHTELSVLEGWGLGKRQRETGVQPSIGIIALVNWIECRPAVPLAVSLTGDPGVNGWW